MADEGSIERYVRVLHGSLGHPKFIGLSAAERGTWIVALVLADISHPGAVHEAAVLEKCPDATFERLYERQLIEQCDRPGWFRVHDLKQFHVAPSSTPEAARARQAARRARLAAEKRGTSPHSQEDTSQMSQVSRTSRVSQKSRQTRRDETRRDESTNLPPVDSTDLRSSQGDSRATADEPERPMKVGSLSRIGA